MQVRIAKKLRVQRERGAALLLGVVQLAKLLRSGAGGQVHAGYMLVRCLPGACRLHAGQALLWAVASADCKGARAGATATAAGAGGAGRALRIGWAADACNGCMRIGWAAEVRCACLESDCELIVAFGNLERDGAMHCAFHFEALAQRFYRCHAHPAVSEGARQLIIDE